MNVMIGPCDADALNIVRLFLKRRGLQIAKETDFPKHRDIVVSNGKEQITIQVHCKGGIVAGLGGGALREILKDFVAVVGTKPGYALEPENPERKTVSERLAFLEVAVRELQEALKSPS
jgi:tRNA A22 N-methylase